MTRLRVKSWNKNNYCENSIKVADEKNVAILDWTN